MSEFSGDHQDHFDGSALDVALRNEQIDCAQVLLANGAKINQESAVWNAVEEWKTKTLNFLLRNFPNCAKDVILHIPVEKCHIEIVTMLLDAGADVNYVYYDLTPLMEAYHHEIINMLLKKGCDVNLRTNTTAIIHLLSNEYIRRLKEKFHLVSPHENSDVNVFLYLEEIMSSLLKYGADVNASDDDGGTVLMVGSVIEGAQGILKLLVDNGADINRRDAFGRYAALHRAVYSGRAENVKMLLELGADVNLRDGDDSTALHLAAIWYDAWDSLDILLEYGADVNDEDNDGNTPLMVHPKLFYSTENVVRTLVQAGSSVNHRNKSGMTVLMMFAYQCDKDVLKVLLDFGAAINAEVSDSAGKRTALSILLAENYVPAGRDDYLEAAEFMLDHGATARHVNPSIIHRSIAKSHEKLVQKLIQGGLAPQDIDLKIDDIWPTGVVSPLSIALYLNNARLARHFIGNWYLTKSDIYNLSRNEAIIFFMDLNRNTECSSLLQELQPLSLTLLSFIVVSTSVGVGHDRAERIEATQLPWVFKERLLFRNVRFDAEDGMKKSLKVLHCLSQHSPLNDMEGKHYVFKDYKASEDEDADDSSAYSSDSD